MSNSPESTARAVVTAARKWFKLRVTARKLSESARARQADVDKTNKELVRAALALEDAVRDLERLIASVQTLRKAGLKPGAKPSSKRMNIPWGTVFAGLEAVAGAAARAARAKPIDVEVDLK